MCSANPHTVGLGFQQALRSSSSTPSSRPPICSAGSRSPPLVNVRISHLNPDPFSLLRSGFSQTGAVDSLQPCGFEIFRQGCDSRNRLAPPIGVMDEDSETVSSFFEESDGISGGNSYYMSSSGEESDTDLLVNSIADVDLPTSRKHLDTPDAALTTVTAHRFATILRGHRKNRTKAGVIINMGLIAFLALFLLFFDWCSWRIVRLPLEPLYLTRPFSISAVLSACAGCLYVPVVDSMKIHQILRKKGHFSQSSKRATPTMGGLFFIPIGVIVARGLAGLHSIQVYGAVVATLALAAIGLLGDILNFKRNYNDGFSGWVILFLQVVAGTWFSFWLDSTDMSTPYSMKLLVPLPSPFGLVYLGRFYLVLTACCFIAVGNGVKLTDGLDGLAGGAAALAFIGMSVAVLAICPELAVFGASMAGACIGFLLHNRYKASIYMGDIGSLALGGALAAMAACTGMFFPLFISSAVFVLEVLLVVVQVLRMIAARRSYQGARRFLRMVPPLHYHLRLYGLREPLVVAIVYTASGILALLAGYVGLISA